MTCQMCCRPLLAELLQEATADCRHGTEGHYARCRLTAELMIEEIGRRPTSLDTTCATQNPQGSAHHPENRESYAWSAAMGLGLITLGKGRNASGLSDMRIEQRLRYCITVTLL